MRKPRPQTIEYYDFAQCKRWINQKYKINQDDLHGHLQKGGGNKPYECFWNWLLDRQSIANGSLLKFSKGDLEGIREDWAKTIYGYYLREFGDEPTFMVHW